MKYGLLFEKIDSLPLILIDSSSEHTVKGIVTLPIYLSYSYSCQIKCYVMDLEGTYPIVLGYNWLANNNPLIDWKAHSVTFGITRQWEQETYPDHTPTIHVHPQNTPIPAPSIFLISIAAYFQASKEKDVVTYQFVLAKEKLSGHTGQIFERSLEPLELPEEYKDYINVFSKQKAKLLPDHQPFDLTICLENGKTSSLGLIYSLSFLKLQTLHKFLDKNLKAGTIYTSNSPCGAPVLFVKQKDSSLHLCVDYHGLNKLTQKDKYSIPLLANLLDASKKAQIYSKIDLKNAYYLVYIAEADEWKSTFHTRYGSFEWLVMPFGLSMSWTAKFP